MERWIRFVYRHRRPVLVLTLVVWAVAIAIVAEGGTLSESDTYTFESGRAQTLEQNQLPADAQTISLDLIYSSTRLAASDSAFRTAVTAALAPALHDRRVAAATTPWTEAPAAATGDTAASHHAVIVRVALVTTDANTALAEAASIYAETTPRSPLTEASFGPLAVQSEINSYVGQDLATGGGISLLAVLVLLVLIFGTVVAAMACIAVGVVAVTLGLAMVFLINTVMPVSPYATDVVGLVGLGVGIDYSLFIMSRFREELAAGAGREQALVTAFATAGRAICFSGLIVAVGLSGMLVFQGTFLVSMGLAGAAVVVGAVITALTLLAAMLALLGPAVERGRLPWLSRAKSAERGFWQRLSELVMRHPLAVLVPSLGLLLLAGSPLPGISLATSDYLTLPASAAARQGSQQLAQQFPRQNETSLDVVIEFSHGGPLAPANVALSAALAARWQHLDNVLSVDGYVTVLPARTSVATYQRLYAHGLPTSLPASARSQVRSSLGPTIAVLDVDSHLSSTGDAAERLVEAVRGDDHIAGATVLVDGDTAFNMDFVAFMEGHLPAAMVAIMLVTFLVLLALLRSVLLPLKAVVMNLLSLSAAFGAMVWVFQQGHLGGLLGVTAQPLDPTLPPLLFCTVYGLSMDYEVFLMTRMQERWLATGDNRRAVAEGLEACGRLITGAAAIMIAVFIAFALGHVVIIKALGLGLAVAVLADATLVRALVVPALMRLLGNANWWAPPWLGARSPMAAEGRVMPSSATSSPTTRETAPASVRVASTFVSGIELNRAFYTGVVAPLLGSRAHAAARLGPGSDVLGFDDARSTDRDWGPQMLVLVGRELVAEVTQAIDAGLPEVFMGRRVRFGSGPAPLPHHVRVTTLGGWLHRQLGIDPAAPLTVRDWLLTPQEKLLEVTGGAVYHDDSGALTRTRELLAWYPNDVWLWLLACQWHRIAEVEELVGRTAEVGDALGSRLIVARLAGDMIRLWFLLSRQYCPYAKWQGTAFRRLPGAERLDAALTAAVAAADRPARDAGLAAAYTIVAREHNRLAMTTAVDPSLRWYHDRPYPVLLADRFADACREQLGASPLRSLPLIGSVDQFADSTEVLTRPDRCRRLAALLDSADAARR